MKIAGQLERAQAENLGSDPTAGIKGRIWFNTATNLLKFEDGTNIRSLLYAGGAIGTANQVIIADGSGNLSSEAALAKVRGGTGQDNSSLTFPGSGTIPTLTSTSAFTNKDYDGGTATNSSRLTVPKASKSTIDALTRKQGTLLYASDTDKAYLDNGTALIEVGGTPNRTVNAINLGATVSGGVFTITAVDGTTLSSTNPGYVIVPSYNTGGKTVVLKMTAARSFANADLNSIHFGTSSAVAWGYSMPFYLYACNLDDTDTNLEFFISRYPNLSICLGANDTCYKGNAPASNYPTSCFFLRSSSPSAYQGKACTRIGAFLMSKPTGTTWTVTGLSVGDKVISDDPLKGTSRLYYMANSHFGATANGHLKSAGTPPSWALGDGDLYTYTLSGEGLLQCNFSTVAAGNCTNGSGANAVSITVPLPFWRSLTASSPIPVGGYIATGHSPATGLLMMDLSGAGGAAAAMTCGLYLSTGVSVKANNFSDIGDDLNLAFSYQIGAT